MSSAAPSQLALFEGRSIDAIVVEVSGRVELNGAREEHRELFERLRLGVGVNLTLNTSGGGELEMVGAVAARTHRVKPATEKEPELVISIAKVGVTEAF